MGREELIGLWFEVKGKSVDILLSVTREIVKLVDDLTSLPVEIQDFILFTKTFNILYTELMDHLGVKNII